MPVNNQRNDALHRPQVSSQPAQGLSTEMRNDIKLKALWERVFAFKLAVVKISQ